MFWTLNLIEAGSSFGSWAAARSASSGLRSGLLRGFSLYMATCPGIKSCPASRVDDMNVKLCVYACVCGLWLIIEFQRHHGPVLSEVCRDDQRIVLRVQQPAAVATLPKESTILL